MSQEPIKIDGMLVTVNTSQKTAGTIGKIVVEFLVGGEGTANKVSKLIQMQGKALVVTLEDVQQEMYDDVMEKSRQGDLYNNGDMEPGDKVIGKATCLKINGAWCGLPEKSRLMISSGDNGDSNDKSVEEIEEAEFDKVEEPVTDEDVEEWEEEKDESDNLPV